MATQPPVPPRQLNPALPADLAALIDKLLAKNAGDRYASAQQVVDAIAAIERRRQPRRYRRWLLLLAACGDNKQAPAPPSKPAVGVRPATLKGVSESFEFDSST